MQKMVVTNLLSSRNQETFSEGHKTMKRNLTLHSVWPVHRMEKRNLGHYFSLKAHK